MEQPNKKHGIDPQIITSIGQRVRDIRLKHGHSMESFAKMIQSTSATINNIEHGYSIPSGAILMKIANAYKVSIDWILLGELISEQDQLHESYGANLFFRGKWQFYSQLNQAYMTDEEIHIHDSVFSLLESIQNLSGDDILLLQSVADRLSKQ
ncbi:helix-turn-helix domain-containing protein [Paenibacillus yanchengensis]|uniref:Helix-turn-helix domain-containing protein n=1 Tax=Paenibacillus yanchengensis TaxID=2035833 RepID=A0ABW4YG43_9BACL